MATTKATKPVVRLVEAVTSFSADVNGVEYLVHAGEVLTPKHPAVAAHPELFEPVAKP